MFGRNFSYFAALIFSVPAAAKQSLDIELLDVEDRLARAKAIIEKFDQPSDYGGVARDRTAPNRVSWLNFQNSNNFRNFQNFQNFKNFQNFNNFHNVPFVERPLQPPVQTFNNFHNVPVVVQPVPNIPRVTSPAPIVPQINPPPAQIQRSAPLIPPATGTALGAPAATTPRPPSVLLQNNPKPTPFLPPSGPVLSTPGTPAHPPSALLPTNPTPQPTPRLPSTGTALGTPGTAAHPPSALVPTKPPPQPAPLLPPMGAPPSTPATVAHPPSALLPSNPHPQPAPLLPPISTPPGGHGTAGPPSAPWLPHPTPTPLVPPTGTAQGTLPGTAPRPPAGAPLPPSIPHPTPTPLVPPTGTAQGTPLGTAPHPPAGSPPPPSIPHPTPTPLVPPTGTAQVTSPGTAPHPTPGSPPTSPVPHPAPQPLPAQKQNAGLIPLDSNSNISGQPAPGAIGIGQYQVGGKTYQYAFCSNQGACEYWNSSTDGVMTLNGQIVGGPGQSAAARYQSSPTIGQNTPLAFANDQLNQAITQLSEGLISSMIHDQTDSAPDVQTAPTASRSLASPGSSGAAAVPEVPFNAPESDLSKGLPSQGNFANNALNQLEENVSNIADDTINQYQQISEQFVDDVNDAIEKFDHVKEIKEAVEAYKKGETDNFVIKNIAATTYEGITDHVIDAATPKNGDPLQDSYNDFLHTAGRLFDTGPMLSDAVDRFKTVLKDMTGNVKANLNCLEKMIMLETDDCKKN
jgi:hypothetical protein